MEERDEMGDGTVGEASEWPNAVTLVLAGRSARQRRWAATTALDVARKLAASRSKVILVDLDPARPSALGEALGLAPGAGIVDVLFRGESFSTVARRPERESFFVLPLGNDPPPAEDLFQHGRWRKIAARLTDADAHLLPCVTEEDWLAAGPIPGFEACIVFNGAEVEAELPVGARQLAEFIAPPEIREEAPVPVVPESPEPEVEEIEPGAREEAFEATLGEAEGETTTASPSEGEGGDGPPLEEPVEPQLERESEEQEISPWRVEPAGPHVVEAEQPRVVEPTAEGPVHDAPAEPVHLGRGRRRGSDRRGVLIAAGIVVVVVAVLAVWQVSGGDSDRTPAQGAPQVQGSGGDAGEDAPVASSGQDPAPPEAGEVEDPASVEAAAGEGAEEPTPPPAARPLPYSVAIASYSSLDDAVERQRRWSRGDHTFYVAPTVVRGVVYYRVFAGILPDREQAQSLMAELVRTGVKEAINDWDVRPTRLAFSFGTYPSERDAGAAVESLRERGIPAYVVRVPDAGEGGTAYHVYAGGYERPADARPLQDRLAEAGLDVELVERVGVVPR